MHASSCRSARRSSVSPRRSKLWRVVPVSDDDLARVLGVNRVREEAQEDARWVAAFYVTLREAAPELPDDDAFYLTRLWLEAQITPQIIGVELTSASDDEGE